MVQSEQFTGADRQEFQAVIRERGEIVVQGIEALRLLRREVDRTMYGAGLYVEWDPASSVELQQWLGLTTWSAMRWGIAGTAVGLMLGGLSARAGTWCAIGAAVGVMLGGIRGHRAVQSGWRLRSYIDSHGTVCVEVKVLPAGAP